MEINTGIYCGTSLACKSVKYDKYTLFTYINKKDKKINTRVCKSVRLLIISSL